MASPPALLLALLEAEQTADPPDAAGGAPPPDGMVWVKTKNDAGIVTVQCTTYCVASFWFFYFLSLRVQNNHLQHNHSRKTALSVAFISSILVFLCRFSSVVFLLKKKKRLCIWESCSLSSLMHARVRSPVRRAGNTTCQEQPWFPKPKSTRKKSS